ncbi:MAG: cellulose synthase family protein [Acidobacteriota bacterium]
MSPAQFTVLIIYFSVLIVMSIYGLHRYYMVYMYYRYKHHVPKPKAHFDELPRITVQLPIFNEMHVVKRLVDAVCKLDYPKDRLDIQVLDDSTDETQQLARICVDRAREQGFDISYFHREDRTGFKAGALHEGMKFAKADFITIFDADFIPASDMLRRMIHYFTDPKVAMVQARWGHINRDYSILTQIQSIMLDGHFVIEHTCRNRSGRFFNFNGTAGIWRRNAIVDGGGWQHDTLTEDLDLSYRAQMRGWRFVFLQDIVSPAEIPPEINAFKSQQHRWAKGSIQTMKKILPKVFKAELPLRIKVEAFFHLSANIAYLLMIPLSILMFPSMVIRYNLGWYDLLLVDFPLFAAATLSVSSFYIVCQKEVYANWPARLKYLPPLMWVGVGLCINNSKAVVEALFNHQSPFRRTPKYGITTSFDQWKGKKYSGRQDVQPYVELLFGLYFTFAVFFALTTGLYPILPFLLLFQIGFLYTASLSLIQRKEKEEEVPVLGNQKA